MIEAQERPDSWMIRGTNYSAEILKSAPVMRVWGQGENLFSNVSLLASVDKVNGVDESVIGTTDPVIQLTHSSENGRERFVIEQISSVWTKKTVCVVAAPDSLTISAIVEGQGRIRDVTLGGGRAALANGATGTFRSSIGFKSVFVPTPSEPVAVTRPPYAVAVLGALGDAEPGRLHAVFSPPPLVLGFGLNPALGAAHLEDPQGTQAEADTWLSVSIVERVESSNFTEMRYEPVDGGWLIRLPYDGHLSAEGSWETPKLVLAPVASMLDTIDAYDNAVGELAPPSNVGGTKAEDTNIGADEGLARETRPEWWSQPLFCGWGAQCALAAEAARSREVAESLGDTSFVGGATAVSAPALATQQNYDRWLGTLAEAGIWPGTIAIDDKWQKNYGTSTPDTQKWPDLKGWIKARHERGQKVLLWFKAWDHQGLPARMCITDSTGMPIAVDPENAEYRQTLRDAVTQMLSAEGLDADGFKLDFTQRTPSGESLVSGGTKWGVALLHELMANIYSAAKAAKHDALIIGHSVNPLFADVLDMVRLNDVLERDLHGEMVAPRAQLVFRHAVAKRALPEKLIDTDQWPMPNRQEWLDYCALQPLLGVPSLYYVESIDNSGEAISGQDLTKVARSWEQYRQVLQATGDPRDS